jgi:hypothetical protein
MTVLHVKATEARDKVETIDEPNFAWYARQQQ